jgi:hypothetical protein
MRRQGVDDEYKGVSEVSSNVEAFVTVQAGVARRRNRADG